MANDLGPELFQGHHQLAHPLVLDDGDDSRAAGLHELAHFLELLVAKAQVDDLAAQRAGGCTQDNAADGPAGQNANDAARDGANARTAPDALDLGRLFELQLAVAVFGDHGRIPDADEPEPLEFLDFAQNLAGTFFLSKSCHNEFNWIVHDLFPSFLLYCKFLTTIGGNAPAIPIGTARAATKVNQQCDPEPRPVQALHALP